ncbi:MAG: ABC transporter permease [Phycisphaerae bacterium]|nr:ABC transporter permease [Phycisphaerae bacterium]
MRKVSTALTFTVVAVVVFVLAVLLSFAAGIQASLQSSGNADNILVLKPGSTSESTSIIQPEEANRLAQTPGIAMDEKGVPIVSHELCVQTSIPRRGPSGTMANVAVRGVTDMAFMVHREIRIIQEPGARLFHQGALEVIVGKAAHERYANLQLGGEISMGRRSNRTFRVVGIFEAGGGALESEIWAPYTMLADAYARRFTSSAVLRLADSSRAKEAIDYINGPAVNLEAKTELDYYHKLAAQTREIVALTTILVGIMSIGAVFAVANTMYAAVDGRRREIAMLRTIGFSRRSIMLAFVIESLLICVTACMLGLSASLLLNGIRQDFLSESTWTVMAYELRISPAILFSALGVSAAVGVVGALAPAVRAARTSVLEALRKA